MIRIALLSLLITLTSMAKVQSIKGWELYVLEKGENVKFSLLEGTNSLKSLDEVDSNAIELNQLVSQLENLASDEFVSLSNRFVALKNQIPGNAKNLINQLCEKHKLNCFLGE